MIGEENERKQNFCKSGIAGLFLAALAFVSGAAAEDATVYVDRYGNVVKQVLRYRRLLMQGREKQQQGDRQERREQEQPVCRGKQAGLKPVSGR